MSSPASGTASSPQTTESVRFGNIEIHGLPAGSKAWGEEVKRVAKQGVHIFGPYGAVAALALGGVGAASALLFAATAISSIAALPFGLLALIIGVSTIGGVVLLGGITIERDFSWFCKIIQYKN